VIIASEARNEAALAARPVESMFQPTGSVDDLLAQRMDALVLGPGLGRSEESAAFAREVYARATVPVVLDADGLNAFEGHEFPARSAPAVLTPHAGELGRLLRKASEEVSAHRLPCAREAVSRTGAFVVLKGDDTLIACPDGTVMISPGGAPALATAGTGDVLAGVIAALLARGAEVDHAIAAAVFAHLRAGQRAAEPHGPDGVIATDVIAQLQPALRPA
jgi:NAD(P)H-hydrate epimerase